MSSDSPDDTNPGDGFKPTARVDAKHVAKPGARRPCLVAISGQLIGQVFPIEGGLVIGRAPGASQIVLSGDDSVAPEHVSLQIVAQGDEIGATLIALGDGTGTLVDGKPAKTAVLTDGMKIHIGQTNIFRFALIDDLEERSHEQLLDGAMRDPATGAFNRRYFMQRLVAEVKYAHRHMEGLALILFDVDALKNVNDRLGQHIGDEVLIWVSKHLQKGLRADDVLARFDGDAFAIVVRAAGLDGVRVLADRIVKQLGENPVATTAGPVPVTMSAGLALFDPKEASANPALALLQRAEAALDLAKRNGRNRVEG